MLLIKDSVLDLPKDLKNTFLMGKMEKRPANLRKLLEKKKNHNSPAPSLLEVQVVGEGSAVARKKILTGGPGSRRFDFKLFTFEVGLVAPRKSHIAQIVFLHRNCCPFLSRVTFHRMTRISGCTFSGLLFFGVES